MRCFYCDVPLRRSGGRASTVDHVFPKASGLSISAHRLNRVPCCALCNTRKSDMLPREWLDTVRHPGARPRFLARLTQLETIMETFDLPDHPLDGRRVIGVKDPTLVGKVLVVERINGDDVAEVLLDRPHAAAFVPVAELRLETPPHPTMDERQ